MIFRVILAALHILIIDLFSFVIFIKFLIKFTFWSDNFNFTFGQFFILFWTQINKAYYTILTYFYWRKMDVLALTNWYYLPSFDFAKIIAHIFMFGKMTWILFHITLCKEYFQCYFCIFFFDSVEFIFSCRHMQWLDILYRVWFVKLGTTSFIEFGGFRCLSKTVRFSSISHRINWTLAFLKLLFIPIVNNFIFTDWDFY